MSLRGTELNLVSAKKTQISPQVKEEDPLD